MADNVKGYLPSGDVMISTSSETQGWRVDVGAGGAIANLKLTTGTCIMGVYKSGDAVITAIDINGNDVSANIASGYFLPDATIFKVSSASIGGAVAMSYINPSFTAG